MVEKFYTVTEALALLGIGRTLFYRLAGEGKLTLKKLGSKTVVPASEIERFLAELPAAKVGRAA